MLNNPDTGIRTDFTLDNPVKPANMNALAGSIQYDYVITSKMLEGKSGEVSVDELLGGNKIYGLTGEFHVLINTKVPDTITLTFKADSVGGPTGELKVHVHTNNSFIAKVTGTHPAVYFYFHTYGTEAFVTLMAVGNKTYVGSFRMPSGVTVQASATFIYELALDNLPSPISGHTAIIERQQWMSNGVGGGSGITICSYVDNGGNATNKSSKGVAPLPALTGLHADKPLALSDTAEIHWVTWTKRGRVESGGEYMVENPYTNLYLDTDTMADGVVYGIDIMCRCDAHENRIVGGLDLIKQEPTFEFLYYFGGVNPKNIPIISPEPQALPLVQSGGTCDVAIEANGNVPAKFIFGPPINMEFVVDWPDNYDWAITTPRPNCPITATPGNITINLGKPTGYTGDANEVVRLSSNIGINAGMVTYATLTPKALNGALKIVAPSACLWTPSATEAVSEIPVNLYEAAGVDYTSSTDAMADSSAFRGDVYLMKLGAKVYVLGY